MKISEYTIAQKSNHAVQQEDRKKESLTYWKNQQQPTVISGERAGQELNSVQASFSQVSEHVKLSGSATQSRAVREVNKPVEHESEVMHDLNIMILKEMIERITGKKIQLIDPADFSGSSSVAGQLSQDVSVNAESEVVDNESEGYGLIYDFRQSHYEYESTSFQADGVVKTADGREIEISVGLNMSREFYAEQAVQIRAGDALKDPLILNFNGNAAQLTERNFEFDIDSDGKLDQISFVESGSGFLAYDKNGDGIINNGSELFGPQSGNGFEELSRFDDDGNNWIDENDDIYQKLRIWQRAGDETTLLSLGEKGVGAIYLGNIASTFSIKDSQNQLLGEVRSGAVFLSEDGSAGTVQQIDLIA